MRLTILGGGGFRVPLIHRALLRDPSVGPITITLHDADAARASAIARVLDEQSSRRWSSSDVDEQSSRSRSRRQSLSNNEQSSRGRSSPDVDEQSSRGRSRRQSASSDEQSSRGRSSPDVDEQSSRGRSRRQSASSDEQSSRRWSSSDVDEQSSRRRSRRQSASNDEQSSRRWSSSDVDEQSSGSRSRRQLLSGDEQSSRGWSSSDVDEQSSRGWSLTGVDELNSARPRLISVNVDENLESALTGADVVFSAIRVHGLGGRVLDERVAIGEGVLGQETVGAGGISYGLRTVPVVRAIAERIAAVAPDAWVVNFTNPAGLVTEAMAGVLGDRVIGICDSPAGLCRRVAHVLGRPVDGLEFDYAGLNHLGWLRHVRSDGGDDLLPGLLGDPAGVASFEEGRMFGGGLGVVPNEYLHYYYEPVHQPAGPTRGEFLRAQQEELYRRLADPSRDALSTWDTVRAERDATYMSGERDQAVSGGYEDVALDLMRALTGHGPARLILNVRNGSTLPHLDPDAVVEVPCDVDAGGARPRPVSPLDPGAAALTAAVKASERAILEAAATGSAAAARQAFALHPLVGSAEVAGRLLTAYRQAFPELDYLR
ncbi:hypothetical protein [Dactylosporangium sp. NPDC051541]|uniref:family 4 glycosyl hydrolase n=1 Tax=Dactylosporangium sp. NPDC051541 TaxID=3363977 RepID=UPI00379BC947